MTRHGFRQVDVFSTDALAGNPVAVVSDAQSLTEDQMLALARWTNLSETTFLLPPDDPEADYRVRIFSPGGELPFAGHPTLGSAHAWLEAGGLRSRPEVLIQECPIGLVEIRQQGGHLAFRAPPLAKSGPVDNVTLVRVISALGIAVRDVVAANWVDTGPGWLALLLTSADRVLAVRPDFVALGELTVGIAGPHPEGGPADFEVRAFEPRWAVQEDPVTGSFNAGLAAWLIGERKAPRNFTVRQGTALGRRGHVEINSDEAGAIWVGGLSRTLITGELEL